MKPVQVLARRARRKNRASVTLKGTQIRPRLSVFRSNTSIYAQIINDEVGKTLVSASSKEVKDAKKKTDTAHAVGVLVAKKAKEAGVSKIVFNRGSYRYHGRVKALAEGARKGGLEF